MKMTLISDHLGLSWTGESGIGAKEQGACPHLPLHASPLNSSADSVAKPLPTVHCAPDPGLSLMGLLPRQCLWVPREVAPSLLHFSLVFLLKTQLLTLQETLGQIQSAHFTDGKAEIPLTRVTLVVRRVIDRALKRPANQEHTSKRKMCVLTACHSLHHTCHLSCQGLC